MFPPACTQAPHSALPNECLISVNTLSGKEETAFVPRWFNGFHSLLIRLEISPSWKDPPKGVITVFDKSLLSVSMIEATKTAHNKSRSSTFLCWQMLDWSSSGGVVSAAVVHWFIHTPDAQRQSVNRSEPGGLLHLRRPRSPQCNGRQGEVEKQSFSLQAGWFLMFLIKTKPQRVLTAAAGVILRLDVGMAWGKFMEARRICFHFVYNAFS